MRSKSGEPNGIGSSVLGSCRIEHISSYLEPSEENILITDIGMVLLIEGVLKVPSVSSESKLRQVT